VTSKHLSIILFFMSWLFAVASFVAGDMVVGFLFLIGAAGFVGAAVTAK